MSLRLSACLPTAPKRLWSSARQILQASASPDTTEHKIQSTGLAIDQSKTPSDASSPNGAKTGQDDDFHRTASRHVLRGILRECTYFPDQFAAGYIRQHALSRFRTYEIRNKQHLGDASYEKRLETVRRKSRQGLYQLQRANEGDRKMLRKGLFMAYGRIGARRRELVRPFLPSVQQKVDANDSAPETHTPGQKASPAAATKIGQTVAKANNLVQASSEGRTDGPVKTQVKEYVRNLPAPLRALVQSQITTSPPMIARRNPRKLGLEIPELNTWHQPMPQSRIKNKLSQWQADLLSTFQPPLPDKQWYILRDLALGVTPASPPIARRKNLTPPLTMLERVVMRGKLPDELFRKDYAHQITPRFMQRLWAETFSQCPLMEYDTAHDRWNITWGHHVLQNRLGTAELDAAP